MKLGFRYRRLRFRGEAVRALPIDAQILVDGRPLAEHAPDVRVAALLRLLHRDLAAMTDDEVESTNAMFHHHLLDSLTENSRPSKKRFPQYWEARTSAPDGESPILEQEQWADAPVVRAPRSPRPVRTARACLIYFIQQKAGGGSYPIKIGTSRDVRKRLQTLQTGVAYPLELLATMPGSAADEIRLHARFRADRLSGEWFRPSPSLLAFIASICATSEAATPAAAPTSLSTADIVSLAIENAGMRRTR